MTLEDFRKLLNKLLDAEAVPSLPVQFTPDDVALLTVAVRDYVLREEAFQHGASDGSRP